jgi:hypothetical protein
MNKLAALPMFASSLGLALVGMTLLLAAMQGCEYGCAVLSRD